MGKNVERKLKPINIFVINMQKNKKRKIMEDIVKSAEQIHLMN